jgi:hypothetical protein
MMKGQNGNNFMVPSLKFLLAATNGMNGIKIEATSHKNSMEKDRAISNDTVGLSTVSLRHYSTDRLLIN